MNKIIIQDEISITQKDLDEIIKYYEKCPDTFQIGILSWSGGKKEVIEEIKKLSEVGKSILLMRYRFNQWKKSDEYKRMEKEARKTSPSKEIKKVKEWIIKKY